MSNLKKSVKQTIKHLEDFLKNNNAKIKRFLKSKGVTVNDDSDFHKLNKEALSICQSLDLVFDYRSINFSELRKLSVTDFLKVGHLLELYCWHETNLNKLKKPNLSLSDFLDISEFTKNKDNYKQLYKILE